MLRLAIDENFNNHVVRGLHRRRPGLDMVRIQDVGLAGMDDPTVLDWAARENRVLLTHDVATMIDFVRERVRDGESMPGVVVVRHTVPTGQAIEDILLLADCSLSNELEGRIVHLPLRPPP